MKLKMQFMFLVLIFTFYYFVYSGDSEGSGIYTGPPPTPVRNIAEWEPGLGVLIRYPLGISTSLIKEMSEDVKVFCIVSSEEQSNAASTFSSDGVNMDNVEFINGKSDSYYTRDAGPWFIFDGNGDIGIVDFTYNRNNRPNDNKFPQLVGDFFDIPVYDMNLTHAGGNYMTDGWGVSASTDLIWEENSSSQSQIRQTIKDYLGVETYHITIDPLGEYIKHIDCFGKFLAPDKILIGKVSGGQNEKYDQVAQFFAEQTSSYGTKYEVFRIFSDEEPYTNSFILNNKVLVPIMGTSNDDAALETYREAMPGYEVIGFEGEWKTVDALHCRTHEFPDPEMLSIRHIPLHDTVQVQNHSGYAVEATIKAYSGKNIIEDSLLVFYKKEGETEFSHVKMKSVSQNEYKADIPAQTEDLEISYYLHAADESERSENHPYIGAPDAHSFFAIGSSDADFYNTVAFRNIKLSNHPNPFFSKTEIVYSIGTLSENAKLLIYNNKGRLIREWSITKCKSSVIWDGIDMRGNPVGSGLYFYRLTNGKGVKTGKMQMIR